MAAHRCICKSWCILLRWHSGGCGAGFSSTLKSRRALDRITDRVCCSSSLASSENKSHKLGKAGSISKTEILLVLLKARVAEFSTL